MYNGVTTMCNGVTTMCNVSHCNGIIHIVQWCYNHVQWCYNRVQLCCPHCVAVLHFQLKEVPEDFFIDIVSKNNFLTATLQVTLLWRGNSMWGYIYKFDDSLLSLPIYTYSVSSAISRSRTLQTEIWWREDCNSGIIWPRDTSGTSPQSLRTMHPLLWTLSQRSSHITLLTDTFNEILLFYNYAHIHMHVYALIDVFTLRKSFKNNKNRW